MVHYLKRALSAAFSKQEEKRSDTLNHASLDRFLPRGGYLNSESRLGAIYSQSFSNAQGGATNQD